MPSKPTAPKVPTQGSRVKLWEMPPMPKFEGRSAQAPSTSEKPSFNLTSLANALGDCSDSEPSDSDFDSSSGRANLDSIADNVAFAERKAAGKKGYELFDGPKHPAKPEDSLPDSDLTLGQIRQRYLDNLTGKSDRKNSRIWDWEIYAAWQEGPEAITALRERERRGASAKKARKGGSKISNPTTAADLDELHSKYEDHFTAPAHPYGNCKECKDPLLSKPEPRILIKASTTGELSAQSEKWHFPFPTALEAAVHAFLKYKRALKKYTKQQEAKNIQSRLPPLNEKRQKEGKPPIPPHESKLDCWIRELDEGTRTVPQPSPGKNPEPHIEHSQPDTNTTQHIRNLYTHHHTHSNHLKSHNQSPAQILYRAAHSPPQDPDRFIFSSSDPPTAEAKITDFYPYGLAYNGRLVTDLKEIKEEDWDRFMGDRVTFEEEMGRTLQGRERGVWDKWMMEEVLGKYEDS
ncbi:MAG: hypothetical protein Q9222_007838 [Ikaeria aurantiellina]